MVYQYLDFLNGDRHRRRLRLYERTFRSKPMVFYSTFVRHICTNHSFNFNNDFEPELLSVCDNISCLECWSDSWEALRIILRTKSWHSLKTLCIDIDLLSRDENVFRLPIFQHVTHFNFASQHPQLVSWESLQYLDNLTHMRAVMGVDKALKHTNEVIDYTYTTSTEARKYFPTNLKYFVILMPPRTPPLDFDYDGNNSRGQAALGSHGRSLSWKVRHTDCDWNLWRLGTKNR